MNKKLMKLASEYERYVQQTRAYLYKHPELSSKEFATTAFLQEEVAKRGLKIEKITQSTSFTALLDTGKPGKTLGIRTDIDALPIQENKNNLVGPRKYFSKNDGVMHACGHDGHMAILLTTMHILVDMKEELTGKIYFIFEEGEEIGSGIDAMVEHLKNKEIEAIYGNHLAAFLPSGKVSVDAGPKMAGAALVDFIVHGQSGHGSRPDLAINPLFGAAHVLTALPTAWVNQLDITKTVTLGLAEIHGGKAPNIIPDQVQIRGTLRFYDQEEADKALQVIRHVAINTAGAHRCTVSFHDEMEIVAGPVINDEALAQIALQSAEKVLPSAQVNDIQWFASEPFSKYCQLCPILFAFIGIENAAYGSGAEHHNDRFDIDEAALINGVKLMAMFSMDYLQS